MARTQQGAVWSAVEDFNSSTIVLPGGGGTRTITAGSLVVLAGRFEGGAATISGVSDGTAASYTVLGPFGTDPSVWIAYTWNHPGGTGLTFTVTLSASRSYRYSYGIEYDGSDTSDPLDDSETVNGTTPSVTGTVSGDGLALLVSGMFSSSAIAPDSPATEIVDLGAYGTGWRSIYTGSGSKTVSGTGGSGNTNTYAAFFRDPAVESLDLEGFRFGVDDGSESTHTWAGAENANITAPATDARLLCFALDLTGDPGATTLKVQVALDGTNDWADIPVQ